jgi:hypothetical protein
MRSPLLIAGLGLILGAFGFGALYSLRTADHRRLEEQCGPELAWIKQEFHLEDADFATVRRLHEAYKPVCADMCRRIDLVHAELAPLLERSTNVTPEIDRVLTEAARLRKECQTAMLGHFFQVSQAMPPEQGRRYLAWMQAQTLGPSHDSMVPHMREVPTNDLHP